MVFAESFLLELLSRLRHGHGYAHFRPWHHAIGHAIEFAGNELEARVAKSGAAVVDDSDPAIEVGALVVARDGKNVIGVPGKTIREIGSLDLLFFRAGIFE